MRRLDTAKAKAWAGRALKRGAVLVVPLVLVNGFAVYGQAEWAKANLSSDPWVAYLFALAVESVALFLAAEAHSALMAGDAAFRLRLASYGVACLVGGLNYSHWAPEWSPTAKAVTFAAMSTVSPWLWSIRSRGMHRAQLRSMGLVDPRTVRFSAARWVLYPRPTFIAYRRAVWAAETDPQRAILLLDAPRPPQAPPAPPVPVDDTPAPVEAPGERVEPPTDPIPPQPRPRRPKVTRNPTAAKIARAWRDHPGATQAEIASLTGVTAKTVGRYPRPGADVISMDRAASGERQTGRL